MPPAEVLVVIVQTPGTALALAGAFGAAAAALVARLLTLRLLA